MALINKPVVLDKIHKFIRNVRKNGNKIGKIPRSIAINYNNTCNFRCDFCYSTETEQEHSKITLPLESIKRLADEAHELGIWEIVLQGGELTLNKKALLNLIAAFKPERFQMILVTNGFLLTQEYAEELAAAGLDCIAVSISSMDSEAHDKERHVKNAHQHALNALEYAKNAGMAAWPNVIFGHHNAHSEDLQKLLDYAKQKDYSVYFLMAMPYGSFKDELIDANDLKRLDYIRKNYNCYFDTWDMYDPKKEKLTGCWCVNRTYISPLGDVFPCSYIPVRLGNIHEQSFKEILDYGFSIKYFEEYSPVCLSAHNKEIRERFMSENKTVFDYYEGKEVFTVNDYIKKDSENGE